MASKDKRGAGHSPSAGQSPQKEVERLIAKGWYKDAIKQAKICYRDQPTPEHHRLLEQAYLLRAQELRDSGMPMAAQDVAIHLMDFGVTDPTLTEPAAALMLAVGMDRQAMQLQGKLDSPEAIDRLARKAADQAILHPERKSETTPEIREVAKRVREVLEELSNDQADSSKVLERLRDVSRGSPFADWRLFARGLAAFRQGSDDEARATWDRLDPERAACRIARALAEATTPGAREGPPSPKLEVLERWALGEPVIGLLRNFGELLGQGEWPSLVRKLGSIRLVLRRLDPSLAVRLTQALYPLLVREVVELGYQEAQNLCKAFIKAAEPLPVDPRWNRFWGLLWEGPQGHPEDAEPFWRSYIEDLEAWPAIQPEERPLARALVLAHLGNIYADLAEDLSPEDDAPITRKAVPNDEAMDARRKAVAFFEESLSLFPARRATHQSLMNVYQSGGQPDRAASVAARLLDAFPDDMEGLKHVYAFYYQREEPDRALPFALRLRKLKPLDRNIQMQEWSCRVSLARLQAIQSRWDEARAELELASGIIPELSQSTQFLGRRACLETKAGQFEAAKAIIDEALGRLTDATSFWLTMAIEARRYKLPDAEVERYEAKWQSSSSGKVRSDTAGALANLIGSFLESKIKYRGLDDHVKQVVAYIQRTTRIKYAREDLQSAASFVSLIPGQAELFEKLAKRGMKLFPNAAEFAMMVGTAEVQKRPPKSNLFVARKHFETALKLAEAEASSDQKMAELIPAIKDSLASLDELAKGPFGMGMGFPFPTGGRDVPAASMFDEMRRMIEEHEIDLDDMFYRDDDEDDDGWGPAQDPSPAPLPSPRPKAKKKKR